MTDFVQLYMSSQNGWQIAREKDILALPFLAGNMLNFEGVGVCTYPNTFKIQLPIPLIPVEPIYSIGLLASEIHNPNNCGNRSDG